MALGGEAGVEQGKALRRARLQHRQCHRRTGAEGLIAVVAIPQFARTIHDFPSYREPLQDRDLSHEPLAAVGVLRMTRGLALLR